MFSKEHCFTPVQLATLAFAFLLVRFGIIWGFYLVTGGRELASDTVFHDLIISDPFAILAGTAQHVASYPPLQWTIEWPLFNLYSVYFSKMLSYRFMMTTIEFASFLTFIAFISQHLRSKKTAAFVAVIFIFGPHQFFSSVFFVQEDVISQLVMLTALACALSHRHKMTIAVLVVGVLVAKIFFVIPLFYIVLLNGKINFKTRVLQGIAAITPIVLIYIVCISNALSNGGEVPIRDFSPDAIYASNYWVLFLQNHPDTLHSVKYVSVVVSAFVQLLLTGLLISIYFRQDRYIPSVTLFALPLVLFFSTFYQHMPEYLLMLWPVVALLSRSLPYQFLIASIFSFAWLPRITHGIKRTIENYGIPAEARAEVIGPYLDMVSVNPALLNQLAIITYSVLFFILLVSVVFLCLKRNIKAHTPFSNDAMQAAS